jgi:hypothetical protein
MYVGLVSVRVGFVIKLWFRHVNTASNAWVTCAGVRESKLGLFNESCNVFGEGLRAGFNAGCLGALLNVVGLERLGVPETHVFRNEISWLSVNSSPLLPFRYRGGTVRPSSQGASFHQDEMETC